MLWTVLLILPAALIFSAANQSADAVPCRALEIEVDQMDGMYFVDAPSLHEMVTSHFVLMDQPMSEIPLSDLHAAIMEEHGVADCHIEPRLGGTLEIRVKQQRPVARVWLPDSVLYLDDVGLTLPLSSRYTADVPILHAPDMRAARATMPLITFMHASPFWNGFIDQVEIGSDSLVSFRPRIGDLVVEVGPASSLSNNLAQRMEHLRTFYTELIQRGDLRQYTGISLQYEDQVVASR